MSVDPDTMSVLTKVGLTATGLLAIAGASALKGAFSRAHRNAYDSHNATACSTRHTTMFKTLGQTMKEHTNIGSILISTGEHAYIYVREENRHNQTKFKHGHFELDDLEDRANYNLSHEDLFTPDKVYERAIKPEKFPAKSPLIKAAEKFKKASWANYSKTWLERISFIPKEDFNRASMEKVTQTVLDKLGALIDVGLDEDVIHGTGHIAVKYKQGNKQHYVIMPTNKIQKKAIEAMPKEHRRAPRKVLKTLQASTAEHFTRPNTETKSGVQPS